MFDGIHFKRSISAENEIRGVTTFAKQSTGRRNDLFLFVNDKAIKDAFISIVCIHFSPHKNSLFTSDIQSL